MSKRFILQNSAIVAVIALTATILVASPVLSQEDNPVPQCDGLDATIIGTDGDDVLQGTFRDDVIVGLGGNDTITGASGNDTICGGDGADIIDGQSGADVIFGGEGNDQIRGSSGNDTIEGGDGDDFLEGNSQDDTIHGGDGDDDINGGSDNDTLDGGNGVDVLDGLWQTDTCDDAETAIHCETITNNGEPDDDPADPDSPVDPDPNAPPLCNGLVPTLVGTDGDDVLEGTFEDDVIVGLGGNDIINGGSGADTICGGDGDDTIRGQSQDDTIFGEAGNDNIQGDSGNDIIDGGDGNDILAGNSQNDTIHGGDGDDDINGGSDNDTLDGGNGIDVLDGLWQTDTCDDGETNTRCETITSDGEPDGVDPTADTDSDGVLDVDDAFPDDPNEQTDTDGDGVGDNSDPDIDGDTFDNADDAFPLDVLEWLDTDGDGIGNNADLDDDGDGIPDVDDPDPLVANDQTDSDGDGIPDDLDPDIDGDGIPNELDAFPNDPNESADTDGDGIADSVDPDADNDGIPNDEDAFPFDDSETADFDGGGLGNNADPDDDDDGVFDDVDVFPFDGTEWEDTDSDGVGNNADTNDDGDSADDVDDAFPLDPNETLDTDFDGIGNNADPDDDNDGVLDADDAFPLDSLVSRDTDGDGIGDFLDGDNDNDDVLDLADAFPNDPNEQLDTDFDGIGNNADPDDDGDTVLDVDDVFPLDVNESRDDNNNGIGDNADAAADSDQDGVPDTADSDLDGDLIPNTEDAFPADPTEWDDTDGDGIGDNADGDDDNDGVPDSQDLLPRDATAGPDGDGDGTPDAFDLDPTNGDEPRFQVAQDDTSGAATSIISDGLILPEEVIITPEPVIEDDPISTVAVSEVVDFTIDGPLTEFETARITIPIDPDLAQQPDPVEVWWFNEEYGLWVPDGTDLLVDPAAATVSVTVDHFSSFVAMIRGAQPEIPPSEEISSSCVDLGLDVMFLVDQSGSVQNRYIIDGEDRPASDFRSPFPGDPQPDRVTAVAEVLQSLDDFDRAGLTMFAAGVTPVELDERLVGSSEILVELQSQLSQGVRGGTDILGALGSAAEFLSEDRSPGVDVIVLVSDGGSEELVREDIRSAVGDTLVHVVALGDSPNPALQLVSSETGGVFAQGIESSEFSSLLTRLDDTNDDLEILDSDFDGLSNCDEVRGVPLVDGVQWIAPDIAGINSHQPEFWIKTDPEEQDTDGDFLWDAEEYVVTDLQGLENLGNRYDLLAQNGITQVYRLRGEPRFFIGFNDPVNESGAITRPDFRSGLSPSINLDQFKQNRQAEVEAALDAALSGFAPEIPNLVLEAYALEWYTGIQESNADARRQNLLEWVVTRGTGSRVIAQALNGPAILDQQQRFGSLFNTLERITEGGRGNFGGQVDATIAEIERLEGLQSADVPTDVYWSREISIESLMMDLGQAIWRAREGSSAEGSFGPNTANEIVDLLNSLRGTYWYPEDRGDPTSPPIAMSLANAYGTVLLFATNEARALERTDDLLDLVGPLPAETATSVAVPEGLTLRDYEELLLELRASQDLRTAQTIADSPKAPFLSEAEERAVDFILEQFETGDLANTLEPTILTTTSQIHIPIVVDEPVILWSDVLANRTQILAEQRALEIQNPNLPALDFDVLEGVWDDLALSQQFAGGGWVGLAQFDRTQGLGLPSEWQNLTIEEWAEAYARTLFGEPGEIFVGSSELTRSHPGLITRNDLQVFDNFTLLRLLAPLDNDILNNDNDLIVNNADIQRLLDIAGEPGELSDSQAQQIAQLARSSGLLDNNFDIDDVVLLFDLASIAFTGGAILAVRSTRTARILLRAAAVADSSVLVIDITRGEFSALTALGAGLLIVDLSALRNFDTLTAAGRQAAEETTRRALSTTEIGARLSNGTLSTTEAAGQLVTSGLQEAAQDFALRADGALGSPIADAAYGVAVGRQRSVDILVGQGGSTDEAADLIVDNYVGAIAAQISDQPGDIAEFDRLVRLFGSDPRAATAYARWGDDAFDAGGNIVDDLLEAAGTCRANRSFSGDALVSMAHGGSVPIADVQLGDQVLAYDFETGTTVTREVTATLPHTDWLLDAHFSDGSVLEVTEDHRFWSITDSDWVELQDLDTDDVLLTPDGVTVTVDWLDWAAGATAPAFDLTVDDVHNFFVAADHSAEPVLVHNQTLQRLACSSAVSAETFVRIASAEDALDAASRIRLASVAQALSLRTVPDTVGGARSLLDVFVEQLETVTSDAQLRRVLAGASFGDNVVSAALTTGRAGDILGHPRFVEAAASATSDVLATRIATKTVLDDDTINAVIRADIDFANLGIANETIRDHWRAYSGSFEQDAWLAAYVRIRKNSFNGSQFELDALAAAGVPAGTARRPLFDFNGVSDSAPVAGRDGFVPDHVEIIPLDDLPVDETQDFIYRFVEAKNLNSGPLAAGNTSNAASQIEWLRRQPNGGRFELYIGENTEINGAFRELVLNARAGVGAELAAVRVTVFRLDSVRGEFFEVVIRA